MKIIEVNDPKTDRMVRYVDNEIFLDGRAKAFITKGTSTKNSENTDVSKIKRITQALKPYNLYPTFTFGDNGTVNFIARPSKIDNDIP